jgi:hypothetical protein
MLLLSMGVARLHHPPRDPPAWMRTFLAAMALPLDGPLPPLTGFEALLDSTPAVSTSEATSGPSKGAIRGRAAPPNAS